MTQNNRLYKQLYIKLCIKGGVINRLKQPC